MDLFTVQYCPFLKQNSKIPDKKIYMENVILLTSPRSRLRIRLEQGILVGSRDNPYNREE